MAVSHLCSGTWFRSATVPVVGSVDIVLGTLALVAPIRAALLYMSVWGLFTALLRPLAGQGWWEFFERSYNFGVPLFMLWMHGCGTTVTSWLAVITTVPRVTLTWACRAQWVLRGMMASMLIGHGGYGLVMGKSQLLQMYAAAGLGAVAPDPPGRRSSRTTDRSHPVADPLRAAVR